MPRLQDPLRDPKVRQLFDLASEREDPVFTQHDLMALGVAQNITELMDLAQAMVDIHLLQLMTGEGSQVLYKLRTEEDAAKKRSMTNEERMIYDLIEASSTTGIWTKTLKMRSALHATVVTRCLKSLESKSIVKEIRSIKTPKRKIFMLSHLEPSEDVSGGPWHQDGELDLDLIDHLTTIILAFVGRKSWTELSDDAYRQWKVAKKAALSNSTPINEKPTPHGPNHRPLVPRPPGSIYPNAAQILSNVLNSSTVQGLVLKESDFKNLLDMLEWDGKLERVPAGGTGYRVTREHLISQISETEYGNGLSDAPCGTCPVFQLCEEGGPVNAGNCTYFEKWLTM